MYFWDAFFENIIGKQSSSDMNKTLENLKINNSVSEGLQPGGFYRPKMQVDGGTIKFDFSVKSNICVCYF